MLFLKLERDVGNSSVIGTSTESLMVDFLPQLDPEVSDRGPLGIDWDVESGATSDEEAGDRSMADSALGVEDDRDVRPPEASGVRPPEAVGVRLIS